MLRKTLFTIMAIALFSTVTKGQNSVSDKLYMQLDGANGVTIMSFSKDIIDVVDMFIDDEESRQVSGPLKKVKMLICKEESAATIREVTNTFEKRPFTEIEKKEGDDDSRIFVIRKGRKIEECHILADGDNTLVMLSFYGTFRIEDIDKLTNKAEEMRE
jgi:hypothetical protein